MSETILYDIIQTQNVVIDELKPNSLMKNISKLVNEHYRVLESEISSLKIDNKAQNEHIENQNTKIMELELELNKSQKIIEAKDIEIQELKKNSDRQRIFDEIYKTINKLYFGEVSQIPLSDIKKIPLSISQIPKVDNQITLSDIKIPLSDIKKIPLLNKDSIFIEPTESEAYHIKMAQLEKEFRQKAEEKAKKFKTFL